MCAETISPASFGGRRDGPGRRLNLPEVCRTARKDPAVCSPPLSAPGSVSVRVVQACTQIVRGNDIPRLFRRPPGRSRPLAEPARGVSSRLTQGSCPVAHGRQLPTLFWSCSLGAHMHCSALLLLSDPPRPQPPIPPTCMDECRIRRSYRTSTRDPSKRHVLRPSATLTRVAAPPTPVVDTATHSVPLKRTRSSPDPSSTPPGICP